MKIVQVNTTDTEGGAAVIAWNLFNSYRERGVDSYYIVGHKTSNNEYVFEIPRSNLYGGSKLLNSNGKGIWRIRRLLRKYNELMLNTERVLGWENFHYPNSRKAFELLPSQPDIVHLHNLHGRYFDLRFLPSMSKRQPTFVTLHDMWLLTGHCAYSLDCDRWRAGCGHCPNLTLYPSIDRDGTAFNWRRKKNIYERSSLYIATPSQWLMDKVKNSILVDGIKESKVIPNGINTKVFTQGDKEEARRKSGLPIDADILVFISAHHIKDHPYKDYATLESAIQLVEKHRKKNRKIIFLAIGQVGTTYESGNAEFRFVPYLRNPEDLALLYQAADLYIHAARADTFPNSILEAMACGTPVIATGVGGIPEQIENGKSGIITRPSDPTDMAQAILHLLDDDQLRTAMGNYAATSAHTRFSLKQQVDSYLDWYNEILKRDQRDGLSQDY